MKLIVGIGKSRKEYSNTRHNMGYYFLNNYLEHKQINLAKTKYDGFYADTIINGEKVIFLEPLSYMNLSGEVIQKFIKFYKINIEDILIIVDDLDTPVGKFKLKYKGTSGGHNGLQNIENHLNTNEYKRLKIGISNNKNIETKDYVLSKVSKEKWKYMKEWFQY